ncbi:hypothetical protein F5Y04DRAFT_285471 [Hypomontagnella monticulosa]|nr:hypothetical protein F5Y04DRAFT_285471 [Hypomontagnella monticulosa]
MPALITIVNQTRAVLLLIALALSAVREARAVWIQPPPPVGAESPIVGRVDVIRDCRAVAGGLGNFTIDCSPRWSANKVLREGPGFRNPDEYHRLDNAGFASLGRTRGALG